MSSISLRLPESLHRQARELAEREDISINQLIATAFGREDVGTHDRRVSRGTRRAPQPDEVRSCPEEGPTDWTCPRAWRRALTRA